jgi:hypothetical protein
MRECLYKTLDSRKRIIYKSSLEIGDGNTNILGTLYFFFFEAAIDPTGLPFERRILFAWD